MNPLEKYRQRWRDTTKGSGGYCPVCDRWGKIYSRQINHTMAFSVLWLYRIGESPEYAGAGGWVRVPVVAPKSVVRTNQLPTMRWWNLVERSHDDEFGPKLKHSGLWRVTPKGRKFVHQEIKVPSFVHTYNGDVINYSGPSILISAAFGKHFDYSRIMSLSYNDFELFVHGKSAA